MNRLIIAKIAILLCAFGVAGVYEKFQSFSVIFLFSYAMLYLLIREKMIVCRSSFTQILFISLLSMKGLRIPSESERQSFIDSSQFYNEWMTVAMDRNEAERKLLGSAHRIWLRRCLENVVRWGL